MLKMIIWPTLTVLLITTGGHSVWAETTADPLNECNDFNAHLVTLTEYNSTTAANPTTTCNGQIEEPRTPKNSSLSGTKGCLCNSQFVYDDYKYNRCCKKCRNPETTTTTEPSRKRRNAILNIISTIVKTPGNIVKDIKQVYHIGKNVSKIAEKTINTGQRIAEKIIEDC